MPVIFMIPFRGATQRLCDFPLITPLLPMSRTGLALKHVGRMVAAGGAHLGIVVDHRAAAEYASRAGVFQGALAAFEEFHAAPAGRFEALTEPPT